MNRRGAPGGIFGLLVVVYPPLGLFACGLAASLRPLGRPPRVDELSSVRLMSARVGADTTHSRHALPAAGSKIQRVDHPPKLRRPLRRTTTASMRSAAWSTSSCSQTATTIQPASRSRASVSASRRRFASILSLHHWRFAFGIVLCSGQPCQKHPRTSTTTRGPGKTTSDVRRVPGSNCRCKRYLSPRL